MDFKKGANVKKIVIAALTLLIAGTSQVFAADHEYKLNSPDGKVRVTISVGQNITYGISVDGRQLLKPSPLSMTVNQNTVLGVNGRVSRTSRRRVDHTVTPLYGFNDHIRDHYNELTIRFRKSYSVVFRVFDNGVAYRFDTRFKDSLRVKSEQVEYNFPSDEHAWYLDPKGDRWHGYESNYGYGPISKIDSVRVPLPMLIDNENGPKLGITEANLLDYPGMYLVRDKNQPDALKGIWPAYPLKEQQSKQNGYDIAVEQRADYIARTNGSRAFPWRLVIIARQDKDFLDNQLVYLLASPLQLKDTSWIKPGKVAWDWWNDWNLSGVNFKTGINMDTYKYYIDFASANHIRYIIMDEGWSDPYDLTKINPGLNMPELVAYARGKNVGVILWCVWHVLDSQSNQAFEEFHKWGISGVKIDFMDRDDQQVVNFYRRTAEKAAKYHLLVDFHGAFKPTGLSRMYPNIINREGVLGLEYNKFSDRETPRHDILIAYGRMLAGPMDFTPGAMRNYNKKDFRVIYSRPMSMGTRCHQLAMYVDYYAPLQMLADAPTAYQKDPDVLHYLSEVPTTWDQTIPLAGKVGQYLVIARRKGDTWFIGAMTNWSARDINVNLSFLAKGGYQATLYADGVNSDRIGNDYTMKTIQVSNTANLPVHMAPGGGWVAVIRPAK